MAWTLHRVSLAGGVYTGLLEGTGTPPAIEAVLEGAPVEGLSVSAVDGASDQWALTCPVPPEMVSDKLRVLTFQAGDHVLDTLAVAAGGMVDLDARAEIESLRAELELVKKALRRLSST